MPPMCPSRTTSGVLINEMETEPTKRISSVEQDDYLARRIRTDLTLSYRPSWTPQRIARFLLSSVPWLSLSRLHAGAIYHPMAVQMFLVYPGPPVLVYDKLRWLFVHSLRRVQTPLSAIASCRLQCD